MKPAFAQQIHGRHAGDRPAYDALSGTVADRSKRRAIADAVRAAAARRARQTANEHWPARTRLLIIAGLSLTSWAAIIAGILALSR